MSSKLFFRLIAFVLASNYFSYQVELFEDEYEENHPKQSDAGAAAITSSSINWETFDKENAPKAFTIEPSFQLECLFPLNVSNDQVAPAYVPYFDIRDKSPPFPAS